MNGKGWREFSEHRLHHIHFAFHQFLDLLHLMLRTGMNISNPGFALADGLSNHFGHLLISLPAAVSLSQRYDLAIFYTNQRLNVKHTAKQALGLANSSAQIKILERMRGLDHVRDRNHIFNESRYFVQLETRQRSTRRFDHHPTLTKRSGARINHFEVYFGVSFF